MSEKLPAIQFYPGDWKKDPGVQALSFHDRGVWFEILLLMHESDQRGKLLLNGRPMPLEALSQLLGIDKQILQCTLDTLINYGVVSVCEETKALACRRMIRDEKLRQIRTEAGKKGGNPILLNQNSTTQLKLIPTPSSSTSSSKKKDSPLPPQAVDNSNARPGVGVVPSGKGGSGGFRIELKLKDADIQAARKKAPGWDIYHLMRIYDEGVPRRGIPNKPAPAFIEWCGSYTHGKPPN